MTASAAGDSPMSGKDERERTTISMSSDELAIIHEERQRTGETFSAAIVRLAMLGLEQQTQAAAHAALIRDGVIPLLPVIQPSGSADLVSAAATETNAITQLPASRALVEPVEAAAPHLTPERRHKRRWTPTTVGEPLIGSERARWSAVGVLSLLLVLMLIPGNGMAAAAVSQTVLGHPGDGIEASNQLFAHYSNRSGPQRHWHATARLADNQARVRVCASRADHFSDYRRLTTCEIHVSSRRRAIEVGQGIVD